MLVNIHRVYEVPLAIIYSIKIRHLAIVVQVCSVSIANIDIKFARTVWSEEILWKVCSYVSSPCVDR